MKTPEQYEAIISTLSRQLAAARSRVDWLEHRYENANMGQKLAREELAKLAEKEIDYEEIASARGYTVEGPMTYGGKYFYRYPTMLPTTLLYSTRANAFKAACEDNGLLGERLAPSLSTKGSA